MADPVIRWAILYDHRHPFIDEATISYLRKDAWAKWRDGWTFNGELHRNAKRYRRSGEHRAVRITIQEYKP